MSRNETNPLLPPTPRTKSNSPLQRSFTQTCSPLTSQQQPPGLFPNTLSSKTVAIIIPLSSCWKAAIRRTASPSYRAARSPSAAFTTIKPRNRTNRRSKEGKYLRNAADRNYSRQSIVMVISSNNFRWFRNSRTWGSMRITSRERRDKYSAY